MSTYNVNLTLENIRTITVMFMDIFIMWLVLYYAIRIVRSSTKTMQIFKGILLVLIIDAAATFLGLKTVSYLTNIFINWGFLAIIIIFQPEIRSILERMGKTNIFSRMTTLTGNEKENLVDQIVTATMLLSRDQTGALISIEQSHTLDDFIATGTKLNSDVTAELLTSLFVTSTPLHDGAVIIQGDKIACASAYFPPTNLDLPSRYGARHRAAIGISEITDALTIVVSEETGAISITESGRIQTVNRKQLRDTLLRVICGEETEVTGKRRLNDETPRDIIIDDEISEQRKQAESQENKEEKISQTGMLSKLSLRRQEKKMEKIETEQVVNAETITPAAEEENADAGMNRLEEGAKDIKLPRKKERPVPSYPKNSSSKRFEEERQRQEEEHQRRMQEETARRDLEARLRQEQEEMERREQEARARREEEERQRQEAERQRQEQVEERKRLEAEERQRQEEERQRQEAERQRQEAERQRQEAERLRKEEERLRQEQERLELEARERLEQAERQRKKQEERRRRKEEEFRRREAEEKAKREAEEKAKREAEEKARREAEEKAKREAEEKRRIEEENRRRSENEAEKIIQQVRREEEDNARRQAAEAAEQSRIQARREEEARTALLAREAAEKMRDNRRMSPAEVRAAREAAMKQFSGMKVSAKEDVVPDDELFPGISMNKVVMDEDLRRFDTSRLDISKIMGMDDELNRTFEMLDSMDTMNTSGKDDKGGEH